MKIKRLEWRLRTDVSMGAETPFPLKYIIIKQVDVTRFHYGTDLINMKSADSLQKAQNECQKDFESRVKQCLEKGRIS